MTDHVSLVDVMAAAEALHDISYRGRQLSIFHSRELVQVLLRLGWRPAAKPGQIEIIAGQVFGYFLPGEWEDVSPGVRHRWCDAVRKALTAAGLDIGERGDA